VGRAADGYADETSGPRKSRLLTFRERFPSTSSDLVATSSAEVNGDFVSSSSASRHDEDEDEVTDGVVLADEVERLAALAREAQP
jgi:hypothetical protein